MAEPAPSICPTDKNERPSPGDLSMCLSCGGVLCFDNAMRVRAATQEELAMLPPETSALILGMQRARKHVIPPEGLVASRAAIKS